MIPQRCVVFLHSAVSWIRFDISRYQITWDEFQARRVAITGNRISDLWTRESDDVVRTDHFLDVMGSYGLKLLEIYNLDVQATSRYHARRGKPVIRTVTVLEFGQGDEFRPETSQFPGLDVGQELTTWLQRSLSWSWEKTKVWRGESLVLELDRPTTIEAHDRKLAV